MLGDGFALYIEKLYKLHIENTDRRSAGWNLGNFNRKSLLGVDEQRFSPTISIMNERQAIW